MSWFDATGFANLAKSALKEAQKTIDKALDIKEDETGQPVVDSKVSSPPSPNEETNFFFDDWGVKNSAEKSDLPKEPVSKKESPRDAGGIIKDQASKLAMTSSLWGSFTGSFFDNPTTTEDENVTAQNPVVHPSKKSVLQSPSQENSSPKFKQFTRKTSWEPGDLMKTLDSEGDDGSEFGFSQSKLVVESEDGDTDARSRLSSYDAEEEKLDELQSKPVIESVADQEPSVDASPRPPDIFMPVVRRREHSSSNYRFNRLSVISSESDKKSSESVEVLGCGSGFTTTPESPTYSGTSSGFRVSMAASTPESVEVIPDTPSSVEIIAEIGSGRSSRTTSSPYQSPCDPPDSMTASTRTEHSVDISPDSVEVIPEGEDDEEDRSMADDSYASASESTATGTITIMEQPHFMLVKSDTIDSIKSLKSPHHKVYFGDTPTKMGLPQMGMMDSFNEKSQHDEPAATHANRAGLSLPLTIVSDLYNEGTDRLKVSESSNEDSMMSDKTLINIDSSCEGTISSDDTLGTTMAEDTSSESTSKSQPQSGSFYVKTMLAEAMGEEEARSARSEDQLSVREHSPISSESRSDMVKIESEQTSGHTSGDELETTTSSDIEIISSPNGCDSSSTQSARHSPAKLLNAAARGRLLLVDRADSPGSDMPIKPKAKGHQRVSSETSSGGSEDSHCSEVERLAKRVAEMAEILEARESKLIDMSRINVELQENNNELKSQLQSAMQSHVGTQDVQKINEEFTQRLSALERKFQQAVREKETLRKQLEQSKTEAATRMSFAELEAVVKEKDEIIEELRKEGGKLSKQELQHSNIIKKLRVKEKENDTIISHQKEQLEELGQELERMKRSLAAKEDVERTQIEAVHQLTAKAKRQEKELTAVKGQLDEASLKMMTLNTSLESANKELAASRRTTASMDKELRAAAETAEATMRDEREAAVEESRRAAEREQLVLLAQIDDAQEKLRLAQEQHSSRETKTRAECADLMRRLEEAEARNEDLAQSVSVASRPLLRQIESLQAGHAAQRASWEKQERTLVDNLGDLQGKLSSLTEQERSSREQCVSLRSRVSVTESKLSAAAQEATDLREQLQELQAHHSQLKTSKDKAVTDTQSKQQSMADQLAELRREVSALEQQLATERAATEAEKRRALQLQEQLRERDVDRTERHGGRGGSPTSQPSSPTLSFGRASLSESISSAIWPQFQDDAFECGSSSGRNVYDSLRGGHTTSLLEGLQSQLKLREGEVQQLQWELGRKDAERSAFTSELSSLTARVDEQGRQLADSAHLKGLYEDVQQRYDALLQMYGEKVEEAQELRLDLQDVKEMYKTQIDQLLKKEQLQENDII